MVADDASNLPRTRAVRDATRLAAHMPSPENGVVPESTGLRWRRRAHRLTTLVELAFVLVALPALVHAASLEWHGFVFGGVGFLVLIVGMVSVHEWHRCPDAAPPTPPRAVWRTLCLGGAIVVALWLRLPSVPIDGWLLLGLTVLLAWLQHGARPAASGGPPEFSATAAARTVALAASPAVARGPFDWLLVVWLLNLVLGTFLGWVLTSAVELTEENWRTWVGARAFLCVVVPVVCVLPGFRYLRRPHVLAGSAVLLAITGFQVATGWSAALDFLRGPVWERVEIARTFDLVRTVRGTPVEQPRLELTDGRVLAIPEHVTVQLGPVRMLWLPGLERLLRTAAP